MKKSIIHISDLHVTLFLTNNLNTNTKNDSYLTTNTDLSESMHYIDLFISAIKKNHINNEFLLIITGDIANSGENKEYEFAKKFIDKILKELNIKNENLLLIPGDHDVHRRSIENELEKNPTNSSHLLNDIKYKNFSSFYSEIKKINFL